MEPNRLTYILVVEDNADDSFLLTRQLARGHLEDCVTVIPNGQEALDFLLQTTPSPLAVFLDLRLPGLSGIELLEKIRQEPHLQDLPVIVMSGSTHQGDVNRCRELGVSNFLAKPVDLTTFIKIVSHLSTPLPVPP